MPLGQLEDIIFNTVSWRLIYWDSVKVRIQPWFWLWKDISGEVWRTGTPVWNMGIFWPFPFLAELSDAMTTGAVEAADTGAVEAADGARTEAPSLLLSSSPQKQVWQYQSLPDVCLAYVSELTAL